MSKLRQAAVKLTSRLRQPESSDKEEPSDFLFDGRPYAEIHQKDYYDFLNATQDIRGEARQDKIVKLFSYWREHAQSDSWHKTKGIRDIVRELSDYNPYIPPTVRMAEYQCRTRPWIKPSFLKQCEEELVDVSSYEVDGSDLMSTIRASNDISENFRKNNLHNENYFFSKYAEWHITIDYAKRLKPSKIVDLGAAYHGFAVVAQEILPSIQIDMVDLNFPEGENAFLENIRKIGANVADMSFYDTESIDLICAHNAFEHFAGPYDIECIKEIDRILKPGGVALITPFHNSPEHRINIQPFSCYVAGNGSDLGRFIEEEIIEYDCRVRFNYSIISPFSRHYDVSLLKSRLLSHAPGLSAKIRMVSFSEKGFQDSKYHEDFLGSKADREIFQNDRFVFLELTKPAV